MRLSELDYELPPDLIAQRPLPGRDDSRLLVFDRATGEMRHRRFSDLPGELRASDLLVLNDTRVVPGRLRLVRATGGAVEVLLVEQREDSVWEALCRPSRRLRAGETLTTAERGGGTTNVELLAELGDGRWLARVDGAIEGELPLPPYITESLDDEARYQTVFARACGSAAAPTAGLHVTPELLARLDHAFLTLHVGLDTFRPVTAGSLADHRLHGERYELAPEAWERIRTAERVVAVGTTSVRALETVARTETDAGEPRLAGRTELMIAPGFDFRIVGAMVTNFHLPRSTLLALVMAFAGVEETRRLYRAAIEERYRFYSFGDAMLLL